MALTIGTQLGSHEITGLLGKGGMGEVYRARDLKLKREVAIKILPDEFSRDPERVSRFQREAEVLASLNHPNIAAIYGLEKHDGSHFLVLELVEGETLADQLTRGPITIEESLKLAQQIADALQAAHEKGVIHRDLKPANIKITHDGTVKVLDFGLAKTDQVEPSGGAVSNSPTQRTLASTPGMILGTAPYMSPEQAKGRAVDRRTDIFAFGCVLYEMLSGKRAFEGEDISDTLASVLRAEPDWKALPRDASPTLRTLIQRCLAKDRAQRIADMSVAKFLLTEPAFTGSNSPQTRSRLKTTLSVAVVVLLSILASAALIWKLRPPTAPPPLVGFPINLPEGQTFNSSQLPNLAVSRDGTQIVYASNSRLYHRSLSEFEARPIPGSESTDVTAAPVLSPDGRSIAYVSSTSIKRIPTEGGNPVPIGTTIGIEGMSWDTEGIVTGERDGSIVRFSPDGGKPERLVLPKDDEAVYGPQILPGGESILFTVGSRRNPDLWDEAKIVVQSLKTGERKTLIDGGSDGRYLASGHLVYAVSGTVWAVPFDLRRQTVSGRGVPVIQGVRRGVTSPLGSAVTQLSISDTGTLIYIPGPATLTGDARSLVLTERTGARKPLPLPPGPYRHPRVSRDGKHAAVETDDGREAYVSIYDLSTPNPLRRLTFGGHNRFPIWSGDSQFVAFQSDREGDLGIFMQRADGSSPRAERLTKPEPGVSHVPESWSHDGRTLLFSAKKADTFSLWILSLADKKVMSFGNVQSLEPIGATFSPDGRWVAYTWTDARSPDRGSPNRGVYVQPFPPTGELYQVPREYRDFHPAWGATAAELFYIPTIRRLSVVSVQTKPSLTFGKAVNLPTPATQDRASPVVRDYDVMPDGQAFLSTVPAEVQGVSGANAPPQIRVVVNWFRELQERVPVK